MPKSAEFDKANADQKQSLLDEIKSENAKASGFADDAQAGARAATEEGDRQEQRLQGVGAAEEERIIGVGDEQEQRLQDVGDTQAARAAGEADAAAGSAAAAQSSEEGAEAAQAAAQGEASAAAGHASDAAGSAADADAAATRALENGSLGGRVVSQADLPSANDHAGEQWLVRSDAEGRALALYESDGSAWTYAGESLLSEGQKGQAGGVASLGPAGYHAQGTKDVYVDQQAGSDTQHGRDSDYPLKSLQEAVQRLNPHDRLRLRGGSVWPGVLTRDGAPLPAHVQIMAYGGGQLPTVTGKRPLDAQAFQPAGGYAGVYYVDVTHEHDTAVSREDKLIVLENGEAMSEVRQADADGTHSGALSLLEKSPGSFYASYQDDGDPHAGGTRRDFRYYFHARGSSDPRENGRAYHYVSSQYLLDLSRGGSVDTLKLLWCAHENGVTGDNVHLRNLAILGYWRHGCIFGGALIENSVSGGSLNNGAAWHGFRNATRDGTSTGMIYRNVAAFDAGWGIYSHGAGDSLPEHDMTVAEGFRGHRLGTVFQPGGNASRPAATDVVATECRTLARGKADLKNVLYTNAGGTMLAGGDLTLRRATIVQLAGDPLFAGQSRLLDGGQARIEKSVIYAPDARAAFAGDLTLADSAAVLSGTLEQNGGTLSGEGSYVDAANYTRADLPVGVGADSKAAVKRMAFEITHEAGDELVGLDLNGRQATATAGDATIQCNFLGRDYPGWGMIMVEDYDGQGGTYVAEVTSWDTDAHTVTVVTPPDVGFENKLLLVTGYSRVICPPSSEVALTGIPDNDGKRLRINRPEYVWPGQYLRVTDNGGQEVLREVVSKTDDVVTLGRVVNWRFPALSNSNDYIGFDGSDAYKVPRPRLGLRFEFPPASTITASGAGTDEDDTIGDAPALDYQTGSVRYVWRSKPGDVLSIAYAIRPPETALRFREDPPVDERATLADGPAKDLLGRVGYQDEGTREGLAATTEAI